eukprot:Skav211863  [mRNA]  locus=scaffold1431:99373:101811:- [translate_table: standard]
MLAAAPAPAPFLGTSADKHRRSRAHGRLRSATGVGLPTTVWEQTEPVEVCCDERRRGQQYTAGAVPEPAAAMVISGAGAMG